MSPLCALAALISLLFASVTAKATISPWPEGDGAALLAFKEKLDDGGGTALLSWNQSSHFCTWQGVKCGRRHPERVTAINLTAAGLTGQISPSIGNLSFLRGIFLNNNSLHGGIPSSIGRLRRLWFLYLALNSLVGEIPFELSNCSELTRISLHGNRFVGHVPPGFGSLKRLTHLYLANNSLTGVIPTSLANASSLQFLALSYNHIELGCHPGRLRSTCSTPSSSTLLQQPHRYHPYFVLQFDLSANPRHGGEPLVRGTSG